LAIHAAIRLHNFIMNSEQLPYSSLESVDDLYVNYYNSTSLSVLVTYFFKLFL
jgi:hypothetical protein